VWRNHFYLLTDSVMPVKLHEWPYFKSIFRTYSSCVKASTYIKVTYILWNVNLCTCVTDWYVVAVWHLTPSVTDCQELRVLLVEFCTLDWLLYTRCQLGCSCLWDVYVIFNLNGNYSYKFGRTVQSVTQRAPSPFFSDSGVGKQRGFWT
jgi:hypothetical protein